MGLDPLIFGNGYLMTFGMRCYLERDWIFLPTIDLHMEIVQVFERDLAKGNTIN